MKKIYSLFAAVMLMSVSMSGQLTATVVTPEEAVALLCGPNLVVSNITFTGDPVQLGSFSGAGGSFEIPSGIVLSSDGAANIVPGNGDFITGGSDGNADLLTIANSVPPLINQSFTVSGIYDVAILEFDFVATGPELNFNYVFGSDEYLTFVNSSYNDVFAFFIAGPGISGDYDAPAEFPDGSANIAVVPNSNPPLPITISSVNNVLNEQYYIDNPAQADVALNGYTVTLTASASLECGETYHMKLAVADGSDGSLKSIVALQEGSFEVSGSFIEANVIDPPIGFNQASVLEGCIHGTLVIHPPACSEDVEVQILTDGIAINGLDYENIPSSIQLNGDDVEIPITAISDDLVEGTESIIISMVYTNLDGELDTASVSLDLIDYVIPSVVVEDVFICGGPADANPQISGGFGPFSYNWNSGATTPIDTYDTGDANTYSISISDYCGAEFNDEFAVIEPEPFVVNEDIDLCFGMFSGPLAEGGGLPYTVIYPEDSLTMNDYGFTAQYEGIFVVYFQDQCGSTGSSEIDSHICDTVVPNIFTPDGDGKNDMFHIYGIEGFPNSTLLVFDRWGKKVFEDEDYKNTWSGGDIGDGVLYYIFKRSDGKVYDGHVHKIATK